MERANGRIIHSATDLIDFVACEHLSALERQAALGLVQRPAPSEEERLVARKGQLHERDHRERLRATGVEVTEIPRGVGYEGQAAAAAATLAAMRAGAPAIHGATFLDDGWIGVADFLIRVPGESLLGAWRYEVHDAKLARSTKPSAIIQLALYSELLGRLQGVLPVSMHAILGDGRTESYRVVDFAAYVANVRARFLERDPHGATYPEPVEHCARCRWSAVCTARWRADDHLSLVANMRRSQIAKLEAADITTVAALATVGERPRPKRLEGATFERLRAQARLQLEARRDGRARYELLPFSEGRGFVLLPPPDAGDLYFDMEGDPFYDGGALEYLFGVSYLDENGERAFRAFLGHDRTQEKHAFEAFIDFVTERRRRYPDLHVYHYATYEASALKRLAGRHVTREDEIDALLRERILVDLYEVVRQSLRASFESYSLKKIEQFYLGPREAEVTSAIGSVVMYERYLESRDAHELDQIVAYNREDCHSTSELHRWLLERRTEAQALFGRQLEWRPHGEAKEASEQTLELEGLAATLAAGVDDPETAAPDDRARWLLAQLLIYHRREAKPAWWAFFDRLERKPADELIDDAEAIGDLSPAEGIAPEPLRQSTIHTLSFPPQEHKLKRGMAVHDPALGPNRSAGTIESIDDDAGMLRLRRGPKLGGVPLPRALCPPSPIPDKQQRDALMRFARAYVRDGATARYRALRDLLHSDAPRVRGRIRGARLDEPGMSWERLATIVRELDDSYLFVQGPPGSGKTWTGARAIVELMHRGLRIGVGSTSHKAIHNLLGQVERVAAERRFDFRGVKKGNAANLDSHYASDYGFIGTVEDVTPHVDDAGVALFAGTAWLFAQPVMDGAIDVLVIDEAGQVSLADAIAMGTAARSVLLLGDPMQLAQVSQAHHPAMAGASVLEHLLGERATVAPERGIFLASSFRMQDEVCRFVSELAYDGRLRAAAECAQQRLDSAALVGSGLRYIPVAHTGNVQSSPEEAEAIVAVLEPLLRGTVTDARGLTRALEPRDLLIVTPYNAQVRRIRSALDARGLREVRAGTVDKFQGQEGAVVFFSMASSSGDELPRGLEFLFDRNRLNVAVSRARALAVLVCSPALLEAHCTTVEQLRMVNALCRFVAAATSSVRQELPPVQLGLGV